MSSKTKLVLGIVGAAAAGVIVGILLAPEKGADTRKKIAETAGGWTDHLSDLFSSAKEGIGSLKKQGNQAASEAASRYNEVKEAIANLL